MVSTPSGPDLLSESGKRVGTDVWAYCLLPSHADIVLVSSDEDDLR